MGIVNLKSDSHQEIDIVERISHPDYASKSKYNDIALLKLIKNVAFNEHVRPACLNMDESYEWSLALATGFGRLTYGLNNQRFLVRTFHFKHFTFIESEDGSVDLMKVQLSNIKDSDCHETYKTFRPMNQGVLKSQFCAGEMLGKKDTCQGQSVISLLHKRFIYLSFKFDNLGDSGGPLTVYFQLAF